MTALSLATLGTGAGSVLPMPPKAGLNSADAFRDALARQDAAAQAATAQPAGPTSPVDGSDVVQPSKVSGVEPSSDVSGRERVRKSLELDGVKPTTTGDSILGGLEKLRGVFDARQSHMNDLMKSNMATTGGLMAMQMEVAQYTVLVDVSSKLTGKASSTLDTLMKGQ